MARLFHSLVVCGAGLTLLDCGGRLASHAEEESTSGAGGSSATPGGSTSTSGGSTSSTTGGSIAQAGAPASSGGDLNVGGIYSGGSGGFASAGTAFGGATGGIPQGTVSQWVCDATNVHECVDVPIDGPMLGFSITTPCRTDTTRPQSPADCQPGTLFSCVAGKYAGKPVLFNCECLPNEGASCACPFLRSGCAGVGPSLCDSERSYCGCAYTCILK